MRTTGKRKKKQKKYKPNVLPNADILAALRGITQLHIEGNLAEAETGYRAIIDANVASADAYSNLSVICCDSDRKKEAIELCKQALLIDPALVSAHYNLANAYNLSDNIDKAIAGFQKVLSLQPSRADAHNNLGVAYQNKGNLEKAVEHCRKAADLQSNFVDAHFNLAYSLRLLGKIEESIERFNIVLRIQADHPHANYGLGMIYYASRRYPEAIPYFERSQLKDWRERALHCYYRVQNFDDFKRQFEIISASKHASPLVASLTGHYAVNFNEKNTYNFCPQPFDYVQHSSIQELVGEESPLREQLLRDISKESIETRRQGRLTEGVQSAGNLFWRSESSFQKLASIVKRELLQYRQSHQGAQCELIREFPESIEFTNAWYIKMSSGGFLNSHIHDNGWLSGVLYLAVPAKVQNEDDGNIELSTNGDNYPLLPSTTLDSFETRVFPVAVGDIILFPASLFHRTIPFSSDEERICIAFDFKPKCFDD